MKPSTTLKSRTVQETTSADLNLGDRLALLIGGDRASISKARIIVDRLDEKTAARLDRVTDIKVDLLTPPWSPSSRTRGGAAVNPQSKPAN